MIKKAKKEEGKEMCGRRRIRKPRWNGRRLLLALGNLFASGLPSKQCIPTFFKHKKIKIWISFMLLSSQEKRACVFVMIAFELELNPAASLVPVKNHGQTQTLPRQKRWDRAPPFLLEVASYAVPEISDFVRHSKYGKLASLLKAGKRN